MHEICKLVQSTENENCPCKYTGRTILLSIYSARESRVDPAEYGQTRYTCRGYFFITTSYANLTWKTIIFSYHLEVHLVKLCFSVLNTHDKTLVYRIS